MLLAAQSGDVGRDELAPFTFGATGWHTMVFVNGRFAPELSELGEAAERREAARSRVGVDDGAGRRRARRASSRATSRTRSRRSTPRSCTTARSCRSRNDTEVDRPIHLLFVTDATAAKGMMHPRNLIMVGRQREGDGDRELRVDERRDVLHQRRHRGVARRRRDAAALQDAARRRAGVPRRHDRGAARRATATTCRSRSRPARRSSRTNVYTTLDGEGGGATLNGLYMLDGEQHCDHQTQIIHAQPNCFSRELYKGMLDGRSHGVFNGKVYVHPIAQKTDGKQTNKTLLLSETAQVDTKPQLEIFADDVKCTHGATVGQIDQTALFYLKSRGIDNALARRLLTYAFAADVLETIEVDDDSRGAGAGDARAVRVTPEYRHDGHRGAVSGDHPRAQPEAAQLPGDARRRPTRSKGAIRCAATRSRCG